ncbi:pyridoxal phosphate-dependent transferase [Bisporella sp. PMI_857]|nr:pyridoxal phosphate-dependent transferase [Bisporella sp. PMI_857]
MGKRKAQDSIKQNDKATEPLTPVSPNVPPNEDDEKKKSPNAWSSPGKVAFDFRSDTITTPNASMLAAIQNTTLGDDVFHGDNTTNEFQKYMAERTTHEDALFVLSGTMGNQLALRAHLTQIPHAVLCDKRAHILTSEAGGVASLSQAMVNGVTPSNGIYLTLEDIEKNVVLGDELHGCPTKVVSLENTLGGTIMPLSEVKKISKFAKEHDIKLHLDGARLWNAVVEGAGSLAEYCAEFDSVSLCFSKGLGAPVGSILVGKKDFIKRARWIRKSIGGGLRQVGVLTAAARVAVEETFGKDPNGQDGLLKRSHLIAKDLADFWVNLGGTLKLPTETNMVWLDFDKDEINADAWSSRGKEKGLILWAGRLVVHYQVNDEAVKVLKELMTEVLENKGSAPAKKRKVGEKDYGT